MRTLTHLAAILVFCGADLAAQAPKGRIYLYKDRTPDGKKLTPRDCPFLTVHRPKVTSSKGKPGTKAPAKIATPCILLCPGGGYKHLSGIGAYRDFLCNAGFTVVHLRYRLPVHGYPHPAPLQDATRAMQLLHTNAKSWGLDPKRLGVLGFSSGGHLASTLSTHAAKSERPAFAVLFCPVISMTQDPHMPSVRRLLGKNPSKKLLRELSNELQVSKHTPPTFLAHAKDDGLVKPQNSERYHRALTKHKVAATLHIYPKGGHGFQNTDPTWRQDLLDWFRAQRILPAR